MVVKNFLPKQETQEMWIQSLHREDPLEKEMTSILAWEIPWTEEPGGQQCKGSQRLGCDWAAECMSVHTHTYTHTHTHTHTQLVRWWNRIQAQIIFITKLLLITIIDYRPHTVKNIQPVVVPSSYLGMTLFHFLPPTLKQHWTLAFLNQVQLHLADHPRFSNGAVVRTPFF